MNGFWLFMSFMGLLIPVIMVGFGMLFTRKPPQKINAFYGYRTHRSMKNKETWAFAHDYFGRIWIRLGFVLLIISLLVMIMIYEEGVDTIAIITSILTILQVVIMLIPIYHTEKALGMAFDKNGKRQ